MRYCYMVYGQMTPGEFMMLQILPQPFLGLTSSSLYVLSGGDRSFLVDFLPRLK